MDQKLPLIFEEDLGKYLTHSYPVAHVTHLKLDTAIPKNETFVSIL